ncbi:MAG: IS30 family transposase [Myxococcaceae bacterium]
MTTRMPNETRKYLKQLYASGMPPSHIAETLGCHLNTVRSVRIQSPWKVRKESALRLSLAEREEISRGLERGESFSSIARRLNRATSTISREVNAQGTRAYRAWRGQDRAEQLMARPKPRKLERSTALAAEVEEGLRVNWSPDQISRRLRMRYPHDETMQVSHETIYLTLYLQGRGALRKELTQHLRRKRTQRVPRGRIELRGRIPDMVNISARPAEADDRAVAGHWEGDLILGKNQKTAIATLVERATRYLMLVALPNGRTAEEVRVALTQKIQQLPRELKRSLTWDQGVELSQHAQFTIDTGVQVYFCDPRSPWQRGSNENTNGLLRQYFPKGTELPHDEAELDRVARELNGRPRQTLNWFTPAEKLNELLGGALAVPLAAMH